MSFFRHIFNFSVAFNLCGFLKQIQVETYCWFASDVTAAMLVVKNKRVSLRWEMNSILMQILQKNFFCINHQHGRLVTWLQTKNMFKNVNRPDRSRFLLLSLISNATLNN